VEHAEHAAVAIMPSPRKAPPVSEAEWFRDHAQLGDDVLALFFFILSAAAGRREFVLSPDDILRRVTRMSRRRLDRLVARLVEAKLVEVREGDAWVVVETPRWRPRPVRLGEPFNIPGGHQSASERARKARRVEAAR